MAFGSGSSLATDCCTRRKGFPSSALAIEGGSGQPTPPGLILKTLKTGGPLGVGLGHAHQPVAPSFFLSYRGSGLVIQRLGLVASALQEGGAPEKPGSSPRKPA